VSNGVVLAAAASSGLANALMLFSVSMVNVFILNLLVFRAYAVITSITRKCLKGKAFLK
jgi:hypothetical protein